MGCIKTGFHGYVESYDEYVYGDAFAVDCQLVNLDKTSSVRMDQDLLGKQLVYKAQIGTKPVYCFRIVQRSKKPISTALHFTIHDYDQWWDKDGAWDTQINSTMFAANVTDHGYSGKLILG